MTASATCRLLSTAFLVLATAGCQTEKSRNPLSPSVAGPIPGVIITAPAPLEPVHHHEILVDEQPVRVLFGNATSNGERPFWFVVEVSDDTSFEQKLYTGDRIAPAADSRTSHTLPTLAAGRTYYWRVKAEDGANAGPYSEVAAFQVVLPVVIEPPVPVSPIANQLATSTAPHFVLTNAGVSGPAGTVEYRVDVARDQGFTQLVASGAAVRSGGGTTMVSLGGLPASTALYWRARGSDGKVTSAWSATQSFRTPPSGTEPGPPPPPPGGNRTPDPAPGQQLPLPNMFAVVQQVGAEYPSALANSCQDGGGTWEFMDRLVDRLRQYDTRWGYNWKRAVVGDPSLDVVNYHWGRGPDEGSRNVYAIDVIIGHCGSNPRVGWIDITDPNGAGAMWTGRGRF
jgi:hypothetical protein